MKKATIALARKLGASNMHTNKQLTFEAIDVNDIRRIKSTHRYQLHKSPSYRGRQSSEYYIIDVNGRLGYVRISNHWGRFSTTEYLDTTNMFMLDVMNGEHIVYVSHDWELTNGKRRKDGEYANTSQAGIIWLN